MSTAAPGVSPAVDERLSWFTRICYGFGDTACNVVAGAMTILTFFYTDYAGVEPTTVGLVMLLSRCFDGVSDVIMGFIVERTNSKWGKSRPWVLWSSIPFCVSIVLIYCVPQGVSDFTQFVYLFITYNFCNTVCYTALNLPYCTHPTEFNWVVFSCFIRGVGFAPLNSVIFGFLGDCVEYGQYKFHIRTEGLIFSGGSIGYKLGTGITGAFITWLMSMSGYVASTTANAVQPQSAIDMIVNIYIFGMIIIWVSLLIVLSMYKLDKEYPAIMNELAAREARGEM